jgi:NAD(P)-dependent dehydrogenase (short-subunit alcohol dehydrogenase family)
MTIRAENADDYDGLLHSATSKGSAVERIVHLWSLDSADPDTADLSAVQEAQTRGPVSILRMVQALDRARQPVPPKLWLISRGAQPVGERAAPLSILQSPLWGLGRTIAMESGDLWGGQVDLDPADTPGTAAALLLRQLLEPQDEDQTAFRDGRRHVLRLARQTITIKKPKRIPVYSDATYLITGGLGGIGLVMARWLASRGARHLILSGRSSLPAREKWDEVAKETIEGDRINAIRELESLGVNVQTVAADMGNETSVNGLIRQCLRADQPPLRGVFHAAGVMQYEPLSNHTPERMRDVLGSKMVGGWLLHRLLADVPLDLFVLFSSSSSLLSSPMMGSYSAANGFLDALAHHRRATGKPAVSINWGTWSETGMALRFQPREVKPTGRTGANTGVGVLPTRHALKGLERVLEDDAVQAGVMPINWERWERSYGNLAVAPYLSLLISESQSRAPRQSSDSECRERILAAQPEARGEIVSDYLAKQMARILKVSLASVDTEKPISNMGFDSLMAIELKNQIELDLGVSIAMARLIQGPALVEMTDWVTQLLAEASSADAAATVTASVNEYEEGVL